MAPQGTGRFLLGIAVLVLAALALLPLLSLFQFSWFDLASTAMPLGASGRIQLLNTAALLLAVCSLSALLGTANGWLTANCRFPGSRWLRIAQLLPLASPAYLLAATLIDLGSRHSWRIHGLPWAITVLMLTTYPYVFLLSTESFAVSGRRQLEACRSLGVGPWGSFRRVALPMAIPAIGAGVALTGMEVVNWAQWSFLACRPSPVESCSAGRTRATPRGLWRWPWWRLRSLWCWWQPNAGSAAAAVAG
jgi:iron(III) transport system permease protein